MNKFELVSYEKPRLQHHKSFRIEELGGSANNESLVVHVATNPLFRDIVELNIVYDYQDRYDDDIEIETSRNIAHGENAIRFVYLLTGININMLRGK